jgi:hypothetical protein
MSTKSRARGIPAKDVFKRIKRESGLAARAFQRHPFFKHAIESYSILDIYTQGFVAGLESRAKRK